VAVDVQTRELDDVDLGNRRITIADRQTCEPKLALTIGAYPRTHPVQVIQTGGEVIDLGAAQVTAAGPQRRTA
jgi:hypothetical protein